MKLTFINGSPRGKNSNTQKVMDGFIKGFLETDGNTCDIEFLVKHRNDLNAIAEKFSGSEYVLVGFPLYVDGMPGSVKEFFEALLPWMGKCNDTSLGFVIQCGFPESYQNRFIERYCGKFARRLGCKYTGSIVKGGLEGMAIQPKVLTDKYDFFFHALGVEFGKSGKLDSVMLEKLARPEHLKPADLVNIVPFINKALWDSQLEKNGVIEKSFDRPYQP
jgi:multimeric flavodoxin WrbA